MTLQGRSAIHPRPYRRGLLGVRGKQALRGPSGPGVWRFAGWGGRGVLAGVADGHADDAALCAHLPHGTHLVQAEQVHGSSVAFIDRSSKLPRRIAGCDALLTRMPGVALVVRSADCVPLFMSDPIRGAVGLAHVGWRGLAARLPCRFVAAFQRAINSQAGQLRVAIGPSIRSCCYEVSAEFAQWGGAFVQRRDGRLMCDLVGLACQQLELCGVRPAHRTDSAICTACHGARWPSMRREGKASGRILSFIMLRP